MRVDGRGPADLREIRITPGAMPFAEGSCLVEFGSTRVLCSATLDNHVPPHLVGTGQGWVTAEYAMLPRSSKQRIPRDSAKGKPAARSVEIQRLIGRSLRAITEVERLGERTFIIDCDVIQADGGTRTASITGGFIALALAMKHLAANRQIGGVYLRDYVAAVSVGRVEGRAALDLCYLEDAQAEVDMNVVLTGAGHFVEVQGTAEKGAFSSAELEEMLALARAGAAEIVRKQKEILGLELPRPE